VSKIGKHDSPGLHVRMAFSPDDPLVSIDRDRVEQVVLNIVVNAKEAMGQAGTITISTNIRNSASRVLFCAVCRKRHQAKFNRGAAYSFLVTFSIARATVTNGRKYPKRREPGPLKDEPERINR
jgi:signal transduction histidine kinase